MSEWVLSNSLVHILWGKATKVRLELGLHRSVDGAARSECTALSSDGADRSRTESCHLVDRNF